LKKNLTVCNVQHVSKSALLCPSQHNRFVEMVDDVIRGYIKCVLA